MDKVIFGMVYGMKGLFYGGICYGAFLILHRVIEGRAAEKKAGTKKKKGQYFLEYLFVSYMITLAQITGIGNPFSWNWGMGGGINWIPFVNEEPKLILLNVILFVPMGVLFPLVVRKRWCWHWYQVGFVGAGCALILESMQIFFVGRTADVDDFLANTLGCLLGYALLQAVRQSLGRHAAHQKFGPGSVTGVGALLTVFLCVPIRHICLGDVILTQLSLPTWSGNTETVYTMEGIHYTVLLGFCFTVAAMLLARKYRSDYGAKAGFWVSAGATAALGVLLVV